MAALTTVLEKLDLTLNAQKTRVVDARADGFDFLGFRMALFAFADDGLTI